MLRSLTVLSLTTLLASSPITAWAETPRLMSVSGEASIARVPDQGTVRFGIENRGKTAADAMTSSGATMTAILKALTDLGIEPADMQSSGLSLFPIYTDGHQNGAIEPDAFMASLSLSVILRDITKAGPAIDTALAAGANRMDGLSFGLADSGPAMNEARAAAVKDALMRAEVLAKAAGVTLGQIERIRDNSSYNEGPRPMADMAMRSSVPIAAGELGVTARVDLEIRID
jgi:uncharacterized protein